MNTSGAYLNLTALWKLSLAIDHCKVYKGSHQRPLSLPFHSPGGSGSSQQVNEKNDLTGSTEAGDYKSKAYAHILELLRRFMIK